MKAALYGEDWRVDITIPRADYNDTKRINKLDNTMKEIGYSLDEVVVGAGYEKRLYKAKNKTSIL